VCERAKTLVSAKEEMDAIKKKNRDKAGLYSRR
jgi:hypothetical protein